MNAPLPVVGPKAHEADFGSRFREIISDPLNLLIERHPLAGYLSDQGMVMLHNGIVVPVEGPGAYYSNFSHILVFNRGVHEPLEEYVFQEVLKVLPATPTMLELGAYWAHYSMWLQKKRPGARAFMVEPDANHVQVGAANFRNNNCAGEFIQAFVGKGHFGVDAFLAQKKIDHLDVLHSDIQGYEMEMLADCAQALARHAIDYIFVSTHQQSLHQEVITTLEGHGYRIEVSSDFDHDTTSFDGLVFASSPRKPAVFSNFAPLGRTALASARPEEVVRNLAQILKLGGTDGTAG